MFGTIGNTIKLMGASARLLLSEPELMKFPLCLGGSLLLVVLYILVAFSYGGTFDRMANDHSLQAADMVLLAVAYLAAAFVVIYFCTGLAAAAHYRLMDGFADFRGGLEAANDRLGALVVWTLVAATVGLVIRSLADRGGIIGRVAGNIAEMLWGWATFLVIPIMVVENATPFDAMRRSTEMFKETWGRTLVANFGFGVVYTGAVFTVGVLGVGLVYLTGSTAFAVFTAVTLYTLAAALIKSMETVYTVALYIYAMTGDTDGAFPEAYLRDAFVYKANRGRFGPPSLRRRAAA